MICGVIITNTDTGAFITSIDFSEINDESVLFLALHHNSALRGCNLQYLYDRTLPYFDEYKALSFGYPYIMPYEGYMRIPLPEYSE
jgi:hypothetical protein